MLKINGVEPSAINCEGVDLTEVVCNGVEVWAKARWRTVYANSTGVGTSQSSNTAYEYYSTVIINGIKPNVPTRISGYGIALDKTSYFVDFNLTNDYQSPTYTDGAPTDGTSLVPAFKQPDQANNLPFRAKKVAFIPAVIIYITKVEQFY